MLTWRNDEQAVSGRILADVYQIYIVRLLDTSCFDTRIGFLAVLMWPTRPTLSSLWRLHRNSSTRVSWPIWCHTMVRSTQIRPDQIKSSDTIRSAKNKFNRQIKSNLSLRPIVDRVYFCDWFRAAMVFPPKFAAHRVG